MQERERHQLRRWGTTSWEIGFIVADKSLRAESGAALQLTEGCDFWGRRNRDQFLTMRGNRAMAIHPIDMKRQNAFTLIERTRLDFLLILI